MTTRTQEPVHLLEEFQNIPRVPEKIEFSKEEENILELWKTFDVFQTCLKQSKGKQRFSFYDGPPFATGLPHYGHILAGTIKDIVTRYAHQQGYHIERRFGWDCHGLPVEFEIDKVLGIKGPADVAKMGIDVYNNHCRKIVMRYAEDWEKIVTRMGRWMDFRNDYKTLYPWYMETVWWVFKELFNKGLIYQGVKVMPYSTACNTPLSNFESGQNYKEVFDPAVIVSFPKVDKENELLLAWTTTPWTLPSNLTLCVNPELIYVKVKDKLSGQYYILLQSRINILYKDPDSYIIIETFPGMQLKNIEYKPLFPYYANWNQKGAFRVLTDRYVSEESGTGIVHQAPYFGEDDYRINLAAGIISRDGEIVCPVDASGCFTSPVTDFLGKYVKDADRDIISWIKDKGRLIQHNQIKHSYPFCWRSDTPLIYKAVSSWFIRVEHMQKNLLQSNASTYWVPEMVKDKRFGNWLREARDWAVSRNRYWGTPIPLWISEDGEEVVCVGSIQELSQLTGSKVEDLHRENIDHLVIPSRRPAQPPLRRIPEVFDCWFESGSMPYAQQHYPFEHTEEFEAYFPAHFIAEGIDQTRGWFYTLLVISTALFNKPPFKNLIANGLILASDGQKMSKRKKNYPDPMNVVNKYGADALRLYLINSPVVRAENLRFKEEGVRDVIKDVFLPWYNAFRFLLQNIEGYVQETGRSFSFSESIFENINRVSKNIMDRWILSYTQSLLNYVRKEMAAYHLYTVVPRLTKFIENLTNWYVRMNRKRLKGDCGSEDCRYALDTLFSVLLTMVKVMAPFAPFLSEFMYQYLHQLTDKYIGAKESVHYLMMPLVNVQLIDSSIERAISRMQSVIELGRLLRDRKNIPQRYPLLDVVVIHRDTQFIEDIKSLEKYILSELNVRTIAISSDKEKYGVALRVEPDYKVLGIKLKTNLNVVKQGLKDLSDAQIEKFIKDKCFEIADQRIEIGEVRILYDIVTKSGNYEAESDSNVLVLLNITKDEQLFNEGVARDIVNRVQKLRKAAHLVPTDKINVYVKIYDDELYSTVCNYCDFIQKAIKAQFHPVSLKTQSLSMNIPDIIKSECQILKETKIELILTSVSNKIIDPISKFVNIFVEKSVYNNSYKGTILLETPSKEYITLAQLTEEIKVVFGLFGKKFKLWIGNKELVSDSQLVYLSGHTIKVVSAISQVNVEENKAIQLERPYCNFVNVKYGFVTGTFLLENPKGCNISKNFYKYVRSAFKVDTLTFNLPKQFSSGDYIML